VKAISEITVLLRNGKSVRQSADAGSLPITRIETIADGTINPAKVGFADLWESDCTDWLLKDGDILISHINSTKHLGKCAIYEGDPPALVHGMNLLALRVDQDAAASRYVYRMLTSPGFRRQLPRITKDSVNQSSFNISNFKKLQIPLPPLAEQKRIAGILDAADALRAKRRESLAQLDILIQSVFLDMFGDPVTNPMGWEVKGLGLLAEFINGDRGKGYPAKTDFVDDGIPFINAGHLREGKVDFADMNYISQESYDRLRGGKTVSGDILYCLRGSLGKTAIVRYAGDAAIASSLVIIRPYDGSCVEYLFAYLVSPFGQKEIRRFDNGSSQPNLSATSVKKYTVQLPPLDIQHRFAAIVESVEQQKALQRTHLAELDTLFASLQSRAFRGDL